MLRPDRGSLAVVEFVENGRQVVCLRTLIRSSGGVETGPIALPQLEFKQLRNTMAHRLGVWYPGRPGDPFECNPWDQFEAWVQGEVMAALEEGDHLVIIEPE